MPQVPEIIRKEIPIRGFSLSMKDVAKIYSRLAVSVATQAEREVSEMVKNPEQSEEEFAAIGERARNNAFRVTITIKGADGSELYANDERIFSSTNFPDMVSSVFISNVTAYQSFANVRPAHSFELFLDFSKPPLLDSENLVSSPTPNISALMVSGNANAWVSTITSDVFDVLQNRSTYHGLLHRPFVYDAGLLVFGLPAGLYVSWLFSPFVTTHISVKSEFLAAMFYIYVVLAVIWFYRILFGYTKWAFPVNELSDQVNWTKKHRNFWWAIMVALVSGVMLKAIL